MKAMITALIVAGLCGQVWGADSKPVTEEMKKVGLEDAKSYAIKHNFEVLALRRSVEEAEAKLGRARSKFFPTLGVAGGGDTVFSSTETEGAPIGYLYSNFNLTPRNRIMEYFGSSNYDPT